MAEDFGKQISRFFKGIKDKTTETVARQEAAFVRGKVAGTAVHADDGSVIVDSGRFIDDTVIARAERAGKLAALVVSAGTAQVQDLREKASDTLANTQEGREARSLDSVDEFREAMSYVGRYAAVDVTDVRGAVVIPAGKKIDPDDVRIAREARLLSALIHSAQMPQPPQTKEAPPTQDAPDVRPASQSTSPKKRASLPMVGPDTDKTDS